MQYFPWNTPPPPPPIRVILQQPPAVPGLPVWATALIGAAVGAVFAILTNIAMEFLKPYIAKCLTKRRVKRELFDEFQAAFKKIETAMLIVADAEKRDADFQNRCLESINTQLMTIYTDRFKEHFDEEKSIYYEIDRPGDLRRLYTILKRDGPKGLKGNSFGLAATVCGLLHSRAVDFANAHELPHPVAEPPPWDLIYRQRNRS